MNKPLADRIRPKTLDDIVGQKHLIAPEKPLRKIIDSGDIPNLIFYGPSGVGKTTLATYIAKKTNRTLKKLNGTTASTADIKEIVAQLNTFSGVNGILLYLDEIQYFNKKQQQTLLEYIENGSITLIASTTENPYFYVYNAILSRSTVFEFKPVPPEEIERAVQRAAEIISEEQEKINDALIEKGEEVTYFPDTYKVSLVVDGKLGGSYARNMLDAIMQSYCTYYTEKYVEQKLSLNPSSGLLDNGYDYYECIRILENDTNEMQDYLLSKREHYPNFRSSRTGYTYADLCDIYSDFKKYTIPALYAYVLNGPQVRDGTVLQEYLANTIETAKQNEQITTEQRDSLWSLTDQYVYKNADLLQNYFTDRGEVVSSDYILNNIELEGAGDKAQTTYDGLVLKLVSLEQQVASSQIDRQFQEEILQSFRNVDFGGTGEQHAKMESMINDYEAQLKSYYEIINTSSKELNLYISADYLKMISSVQVAAAINVKLYLMLALVLFFVIGCCGAILLGRISDAVDYLLYVDKKTGLPNREKLNVYISGMADRILPEDYTCFALQLDNLTEMSRRFGYHVGDGILKDFSGLLQLMGDTDGTVGYNGAGKFLAFFDECSTRKAEVMIRILQSQVDEYNKLNPEYPILFTAAWATTSEEELYHVRDLVRCAQKKMSLIAEEGGAVLAGMERGEA